MPPVVIGVVADAIWAAAGAVGITASAATFVAVATTVVSVGISLGASYALGTISRALQRKPGAVGSLLHNGQGRLITVRQPAPPRRIIYGSIRTGGVITFLHDSGGTNDWFLMVLTLAGHEIGSIDTVYMDGNELALDGAGDPTDPVFTSNVHIEFNLGYAGQESFPSIISDSAGLLTSTFRQRGNACVYIRLKFDAVLFPKGLPNFTFDVTGKLLFDCRTDTVKTVLGATNATPIVINATAHGFTTGDSVRVRDVLGNKGANGVWLITVSDADHFELDGSDGTAAYTSGGTCYKVMYSNNSALAWADFLSDPIYGFKARYNEELDLTRLTAAANVCDESVQVVASPLTYEARYATDGMLDTTEKRGQTLQQLQGAMCGWGLPIAGTWVCLPGAYRTPVLELDENDFIAPLQIRTKQSRRDLFNGVKGTFVSPDNDWQTTDFPIVQDAAYLAEDDGISYFNDISLPFTTSPFRCQRIAAIDMNRQRRQVEVQATCKMRAYKAQPGDVIEITLSRLGWAAKTFEVLQMQLAVQNDASGNPGYGIAVRLKETDVAVYGFTAYETPVTPPAVVLPGSSGGGAGGAGAPPAPADFTLTANPGGDLSMSHLLPVGAAASYRSGSLYILADFETERVGPSASLVADLADVDVQMIVDDTTNLVVDGLVNVDTEILRITGPGTIGAEPSSTTLDIARGIYSSTPVAATSGDAVYILNYEVLPFEYPLDLVDGTYFYHRFRPGRRRILWAGLSVSNGEAETSAEDVTNLYGFNEPSVGGTLSGLRSSRGEILSMVVPGPLHEGDAVAGDMDFPDRASIGLMYAILSSLPADSQPVKFRLDSSDDSGQTWTTGGEISIDPAGDGGFTGTGVFASGAQAGDVGGLLFRLVITQAGDTGPGEDLTILIWI